jgi:hypothetical protein
MALHFAAAFAGLAAETNSAALPDIQPAAGLYVCEPGPSIHVNLRLETNGSYQVQADLGPAIGRQSQEGTWKWDGQKQEFSLTPNTDGGKFQYELRRLRVDKQQANNLLWLPGTRTGSAELEPGGTIDYFRFKRKD